MKSRRIAQTAVCSFRFVCSWRCGLSRFCLSCSSQSHANLPFEKERLNNG